jgi:hypothetical protein
VLKKLALAGALVLAVALAALAANAPTYTDVAGRLLDAQGVVLIDTTGQPYNAAGSSGSAGVVGNGAAATAQRVTVANDSTGIIASTSTGNVASGATDSGNPVKVGGKYNVTLPTFTDGQRADLQVGNRGALITNIAGSGTGIFADVANGLADGASTAATALLTGSRAMVFNGTTWDRAFTCTSTVAVTAAAGTTQIVALSGSTVVRVCSYSLSMAAAGAGTVAFVYGTGANCGTGTTNISAAMPLAANQNMTASAANGSLLRGLAANALCLTVATNTVTGYVTYAQF